MAGLLLLPIFLIVFWVMIVMPQKRMRQAHDALVASLEPGQEIMTTAGVYGTITRLEGETAHLEIAPGVVIRIDKRSVGAVMDAPAGTIGGTDLAAELGDGQAGASLEESDEWRDGRQR